MTYKIAGKIPTKILSNEAIAKLQFLQLQPLKNAYFAAFRREIA